MNIRKVSYLFVAVTVMSGFSFQPTEADTSGAVGIISGRGLFSTGKCFSLFTPISDVVQQYGVNVKVN